MQQPLVAVTFCGLLACSLAAPFAFSNTLSNDAVLQQPVTIWGTGTPGATVTTAVAVTADEGARNVAGGPPPLIAEVGADGIWRQAIDAAEGFDPLTITSKMAGVSIALTGLTIGKVILCSGQSNIQTVTVARAFNSTAETAACANFPGIRLAKVVADRQGHPLADLGTGLAWAAASNASCSNDYSATCWFTARTLYEELGGTVPVGVIESSVGGTAVRNWVPEHGLAQCSQPWSGLEHYGFGPYTHSTLFNAMVAPFGTGPTSFSFVLWDQAESDSFPQTNPGYYGCQTLAHINTWRELLRVPLLPWVFVHLQPYTGSEQGASDVQQDAGLELYGDPLAELRHEQLNALALPAVGYASAIDLGDPTSPMGNVHFQNKQTVGRRAVSAAMRVAFGKAGGSGGALAYPPPSFLGQTPAAVGSGCSMTVRFRAVAGGAPAGLAFGSTVDPGTGNSSAICPYQVPTFNCTGFELLCTTSEIPHNASNPALWLPAVPALSADGASVVITAKAAPAGLVARASRYGWSAWPLATLFAAGESGVHGLPVLPWNQAMTCTGGAVPNSPC